MPIDAFGLAERLVVWIRAQPSGVTLQVNTDDVLRELQAIYPPRADLGTVDELWAAMVQADAEDEELGNANKWRSFVLIAWSYLPGDSVVTGTPATIRFMCPRSAWDVVQ